MSIEFVVLRYGPKEAERPSSDAVHASGEEGLTGEEVHVSVPYKAPF
jgi:hypothetical protein